MGEFFPALVEKVYPCQKKNLNYGTDDKPVYKTETDLLREQTCGYQGGGRREQDGLGVWG